MDDRPVADHPEHGGPPVAAPDEAQAAFAEAVLPADHGKRARPAQPNLHGGGTTAPDYRGFGAVVDLRRYYSPNPAMLDRVRHDFTYHPPTGDQPERYELIRKMAREFAELLVWLTPASREQSLALTSLEQAVFNANAAIARNER